MVTLSESVQYRAMVLAAGRGERMRPLTDAQPKPLLQAGGRRLIEYQISSLAEAGFRHIVINHAYLGAMIEDTLGRGDRYGVRIVYSPEKKVLETAGGIANALLLLTEGDCNRPFLVVNADVYCEFDYASLLPILRAMHRSAPAELAHLVLVDNPPHHDSGDFALRQGKVALAGENRLTFSGIGIYHPLLFKHVIPGIPVKLAPILHTAIDDTRVTGEYFPGTWLDIGTPDRLMQLDRLMCARHANSGQSC
ncbi:MurNAc alpha-1-phosphate uridylyltransferase [Nitrosomonas marina]|uniref:MurNAc alpha-1-phosphate uridylyltransferase n=1 Tax=Nitrosomonas marina TaxID=917 RepID=A0A1I0FHG3_9PROT|nr:MurNAc alpha-1-phosphate uridylyltransferase [Nitrosomonas marina]